MALNDKYGYHEVVHTSAIIANLFDWEIGQHRVVDEHPELKEKANEIIKMLYNFYQQAASVSADNFRD